MSIHYVDFDISLSDEFKKSITDSEFEDLMKFDNTDISIEKVEPISVRRD